MSNTTAVGYTQSVALLTSVWADGPDGGPAAVTDLTITIKSLPDLTTVVGPTSVGILNPALGRYTYRWVISAAGAGNYRATWSGLNAAAQAVSTTEDFEVVESTIAALATWLAPDVARRTGLLLSDTKHVSIINDALVDAIIDAIGYLGRPVLPTEITEQHVRVVYNPDTCLWEYDLAEDPVHHILSAVAETDADGLETGLYAVTYIAGVDARDDQYLPIKRWIVASASYAHPLVLRQIGNTGRMIKSVSAEGQSVTYDNWVGANESPTAGVPKQATMDKWRRRGRRAYTQPGWTPPPNY